jgi:hypothetical protein
MWYLEARQRAQGSTRRRDVGVRRLGRIRERVKERAV